MSAPRDNVVLAQKDYRDRLVVTDSATEPQLETSVVVTVPDAATGDIDIVMASKFEVIDVQCLKRNGAGAGNTVTVKNGANAITDAIACATDNALTRSASVDDAQSTIAKGGTLRLSCTRAAGTRDSLVVIRGLMRA